MQEIQNLFDEWNKVKKEVNFLDKNFFPKHKEVWYIGMGINIGFESNGKGRDFKRPILVLKRIGNNYLVVSMTTKGKIDNDFYFELSQTYFKKKSFINLSQFRTVDKKRFIEKIGKIEEKDFSEIKNKIKKLF